MKTYFVCSDIHSFYDELMLALNEASFDINNNNHILIVLGDIFDRGDKTIEVYKFLRSIPEDRLILIKGNHEQLLLDLIERKYPCDADFSNRTYKTLTSFSKDPISIQKEWLILNYDKYEDANKLLIESRKVYESATKVLYNNPLLNEVVEWLKSDKWSYYYELGNYVFVHSFIPLSVTNKLYGTVKYNPNWRNNSSIEELKESTWGCPYLLFKAGLFDEEIKKGKVLVCGHWHTSDFYNKLLYPNEQDKWLDIKTSNPIFKSDKFPNLIGLDACTALTHKINVLVIKEKDIG